MKSIRDDVHCFNRTFFASCMTSQSKAREERCRQRDMQRICGFCQKQLREQNESEENPNRPRWSKIGLSEHGEKCFRVPRRRNTLRNLGRRESKPGESARDGKKHHCNQPCANRRP